MTRWCKGDSTRECFPLLKTLLGRKGVQIEVSGGLSFIDEVVSIEHEGSAPIAVFGSRRRVAVRDIETVEWVADLS